MPPPKSKVWQYFNKTVDGAECKLCSKKVVSKGGNTTNLAVHLRRAHKIECTPHPSVAGMLKKVAPTKQTSATATLSLTEAMSVEPPIHMDSDEMPALPKMKDCSSDSNIESGTTVSQTTETRTEQELFSFHDVRDFKVSVNRDESRDFQWRGSSPMDFKTGRKFKITWNKTSWCERYRVLLVSSQGKSEISIWDRARTAKLDSAKQQRITRMMAVYLVKDMRPFSTVQSVNFRNMIHAIDARVVIPNSDTFSQRIIPSWYNIEVAKLMEELQSTKHVSLTSDCWTSRTTIPYMTVTAHFLDENYDLKSKVLQTRVLDERHTGENISVALNSVLQSWKIDDKVSVITTDNASNMGRAVQISDIPLQIGCFAHTLDLAAKKAVEVAKPLSKHMKPVINFLHRSHIGAKVIKEKQEALHVPTHKLITDIETRWNSTYLMFERYFEQRVAIHATFMDKRLEAHKSVYRDFKDSEVVKAEEFLETMKPFYEMTLAICSEKKNPTASLILPLCDKILKRCEPNDNDSDFTKQLKKAIGDNLSKRYNEKPVRDYLLKCTALDPRMKLKSIVQESTWQILSEEIVELLELEEMVRDSDVVKKEEEEFETEASPSPKKKAKTLMETFLTDDDDDEITVTSVYKRSHQEMAADEIKAYREMPKHANPLLFYQSNRYRLPHLYILAAKYLIAQATSVASERVFSTSGDILSAERSCLDADALDAMIFLKKNAKAADFIV